MTSMSQHLYFNESYHFHFILIRKYNVVHLSCLYDEPMQPVARQIIQSEFSLT